MVFLFGLILTTAAEECPDRSVLLTKGQEALLQGRLDDAQQTLTTIQTTFDCQSPVSPQELGYFAMLQGAVYFFDNQPLEAQHHFRLAHQLDGWDPIYGPQLHQQYLQSIEQERNRIHLSVQSPHRYRLLIDGANSPHHTTLDSNYHLIQIIEPKGTVYSSQFEHFQSDRIITISPPPNPKRPVLMVSLGGLICSSASFALALHQNHKMEQSTTLVELDSSFRRQQVFSTIGWTTLGIATIGGMWSWFW